MDSVGPYSYRRRKPRAAGALPNAWRDAIFLLVFAAVPSASGRGRLPVALDVFQMATTLTVGAPAAPRSVILINGAQAKNVYWQVGSSATINRAGVRPHVGYI